MNLPILAIDMGYGDTKAMSYGPTNPRLVFRSAFAPFRSSGVPLGTSYGITVETSRMDMDLGPESRNVGPFIVGDKSPLYPGATEPAGKERLGTDAALLFIGEAMLRSGISGDFILSTGAPLDLFAEESRKASRLSGVDITVKSTKGQTVKGRIVNVITRPQGFAAAMALRGADKFPKVPGIAVLVDIGSRTTDVMSIALTETGEGLDPIPPLCFSIPVGVGEFLNRIGEGISRELKDFQPQRTLIQANLGQKMFHYSGKSCELAPIEAAARTSTVGVIVEEIRRRFGEQIPMVVSLAVVGGGAKPNLLAPVSRGLFPGAVPLEIDPDHAVFMNTEGYLLAAIEQANH